MEAILQQQAFQPSGLNNQFFLKTPATFAEYIQQTKSLIRQSRINAQLSHDDFTIEANSPFQYIPKPTTHKIKNGIIFIHGFMDSPFSFYDLSHDLVKEGYLVRSILLPGHGTCPGDLLNIRLESWIEAAEYGISSLKNDVENIYIAGLSSGASLALYHALANVTLNIKGLLLFAPSLRLRNPLSFTSQWLKYFGHLHQRASWYQIANVNNKTRYECCPFNGVHQAYRLTRRLKKQRKKYSHLNYPIFMIITDSDETVSYKHNIRYFHEQRHPKSQLLVYSASKFSYPYHDKRVEIRSSYYPTNNILDFSHICLQVSPKNPYYCADGEYEPTYYYPNNLASKETPEHIKNHRVYQGALNKHNLQYYPLTRLTYNPDYDHLLQRAIHFIQHTSKN
ncbi:MAG: alpha/beta hydrolase [Gammaproteobacteria bacterium]